MKTSKVPTITITSPARSQGQGRTPRREKARRTRSVGSPATSNASGRLTSVLEGYKDNNDSYALILAGRKSVLTDNTDIADEPRRRSWWKKLNENSRDVMEILEDNNVVEPNNIMEELDMEVLSQENQKKNYTLDLPESSDGESINSIVLPQRKLFTQKENQPQKKFGEIMGTRDTLTKINKNTTVTDKTITAGTKELFQNKQRSKPMFPAALLTITPDKTLGDKTKEFATAEPKGQVRNIFGNRAGTKRKNMFANFIVSESEDEIPDIQPKVFGFPKKSIPQRRGSSQSKRSLRESSPASVTTDIEMDDWKHLPSSTMVEHQFEAMFEGVNSPVKRPRLGKLSETKESETSNKSKGNKSAVKNTSKASKNSSKVSLEENDKEHTLIQNKSQEQDDLVNKSKGNKSATKDTSMVTRNRSKVLCEENEKERTLTQNKSQELNNSVNKSKGNKSKNKSEVKNKTLTENKSQEQDDFVNKSHGNKSTMKDTSMVTRNRSEVLSEEYEKERTLTQNKSQEQSNSVIKSKGDKSEVKNKSNATTDDIINESGTSKNTSKQDTLSSKSTSKNKSLSKNKTVVNDNVKDVTITENKQTREPNKETNELNKSENHSNKIQHEVDKIQDEIDEYKNKSDAQADQSDDKTGSEKANESGEKDTSGVDKKAVNESRDIVDDMEEANVTQEKDQNDDQENENQEAADQSHKSSDQSEEVYQSQENIDESEEKVHQSEEKVHQSEENNDESQEAVDQSQEQKETSTNEVNQSQVQDASDNELDQNDEEVEQNDNDDEVEQSEVNMEQSKEQDVSNNENEPSQEDDDDNKADESQEDDQSQLEQDESDNEVNQTQKEQDASDNEVQQEQDASDNEVDQSHEQDASDNEVQQGQEIDEESEEIDEGLADESEQVEQSQENDAQSDNDEDDEQSDNEENDEQSDNEDNDEQSDNEEDDAQSDEQKESQEQESEHSENDANLHYDSEDMEVDNENENNENTNPDSNPKEIVENSQNISHDTTGRHRQKHQSPDIIRHKGSGQNISFSARRNTSLRRTSMIKSMTAKTSLAPQRDSVGFSDGTTNSSAEGSGWDSHRTTRKTIRQTFGKDFSIRKSLRTLVMEKSAKRQTLADKEGSETAKFPLANSTELPEMTNMDYDDGDHQESTHEVSLRTRQTTLEAYLQKVKMECFERKAKLEEAVRNSIETHAANPFKVPARPLFPRKPLRTFNKVKKQPNLKDIPEELIADMQYKPPKRFRPSNAAWATKRLYKYLETKLEPKYDYKARVRSEKLVETIYQFTKDVRRQKVASTESVDVLKHEMARLDIVKTHYEFYNFFHQFMPREVRVKVVPDIVNKIPLPSRGVFADIVVKKPSQG